jgi:excisionase family DNA binding protein
MAIPFRERYCTINEAAEATGSGRSKIYELIKAARIRTVRIDGRQKVVVASLLSHRETIEENILVVTFEAPLGPITAPSGASVHRARR